MPDLRRPVFVIGAPRSGTTFLGDCLVALPQFSCHHEPVATKAAIPYVYKQEWSFAKASFYYRQVYGWLMRLYLDGDLRFAEKTPRNCMIIPFLSRAFADAQIVHLIRDGRDVAASLRQQPWLRSNSEDQNFPDTAGYRYGPARDSGSSRIEEPS
jgi:hypothetical protein